MTDQTRFQYIADALRGEGPFRPVVNGDSVSRTVLMRYPRESDKKFAARNAGVADESPLYSAASRFAGFLSSGEVSRSLGNALYETIADDADGKGSALPVFWFSFALEASARGSMLLLVDMPPAMPSSLDEQIEGRVVPVWTPIPPERVARYSLGDDGKFDYVEIAGLYTTGEGKRVDAIYGYSRTAWAVSDYEGNFLDAGEHDLGECPVLAFTEVGDYPSLGRFSSIADLTAKLYNRRSELDELLRSQTFSILTMQIPQGTTADEQTALARAIGETIGTQNMMMHTGTTPSFVSPESGPADVYLRVIERIEAQIERIGLDVKGANARESGVALQMRFRELNAALSSYATRLEDLERRAWELSRRWLGLTSAPEVRWPHDFNLSDIEAELAALQQMQASDMPPTIVAQQIRRIVAIQFPGLSVEARERIEEEIAAKVKQV